jgi:hypothetical protein
VIAPSVGLQNNYTFAVWIKPQGTLGNHWIMGEVQTNGQFPWQRMFIGQDNDGATVVGTSSKVSFMLPFPSTTALVVTDPKVVALDTWHHYAVTVSYVSNTTTIKLYRDGAEVATGSKAANGINFATLNMLIGNGQQGAATGTGTRVFKGAMDEVRVYARALNANDIIAIKDAPSN